MTEKDDNLVKQAVASLIDDAKRGLDHADKLVTTFVGTEPEQPLKPEEMAPLQRAYYETAKYTTAETLKIPFVGVPLVNLSEASYCSPIADALVPNISRVTCQGWLEGQGKKFGRSPTDG